METTGRDAWARRSHTQRQTGRHCSAPPQQGSQNAFARLTKFGHCRADFEGHWLWPDTSFSWNMSNRFDIIRCSMFTLNIFRFSAAASTSFTKYLTALVSLNLQLSAMFADCELSWPAPSWFSLPLRFFSFYTRPAPLIFRQVFTWNTALGIVKTSCPYINVFILTICWLFCYFKFTVFNYLS